MDPDPLASVKPADLDLHCFQNRMHLDLKKQGLKLFLAGDFAGQENNEHCIQRLERAI